MSDYSPENALSTFPELARLLWVMNQLRDPDNGCPWDLQQNFASLVSFTIEEAYEVVDAIESGNMEQVKDELGDLLFQVVFYAKLGDEQKIFDFEAIAHGIASKLIRRHPHVFDTPSLLTEEQISANWERIKQQERQGANQLNDDSILAHITEGLPPLVKAVKLQKRCAKVGFDWENVSDVVAKINEEVDEVLEEVHQTQRNQTAIEEEIGDLLFAVTNLSRHLNVDPERALRVANRKFENRFRLVEENLKNQNLSVQDASLEMMEASWVEAKRLLNAKQEMS